MGDGIGGQMRRGSRNANARSGRRIARSKISSPTRQEWQCRPTGAYFLAMLVSAAIDPYRNSYGKARSSSATAGGQRVERSHDGFAQEHVRAGRPGERRRRGQGDSEQHAHAPRARPARESEAPVRAEPSTDHRPSPSQGAAKFSSLAGGLLLKVAVRPWR